MVTTRTADSSQASPVDEPEAPPTTVSSTDSSPKNKPTSTADEAQERPVRRQLKETTIGDLTKEDAADDTDDSTNARGRVSRKRSFESLREPETTTAERDASSVSKHIRKRSRDAVGDDPNEAESNRASFDQKKPEAEAAALSQDKLQTTPPPPTVRGSAKVDEVLTSPQQGKRSRADDAGKENGDGEERISKKRPQSPEKKSLAAPQSSGFANFSSESPFASLGGAKASLAALSSNSKSPETKETTPSAFAASGFASLASSASSPFASLTSDKLTGDKTKTNGDTKPSGFASLSTSSASPFASTGSSTVAGTSAFGGTLGGNSLGSAGTFGPPLGAKLKSFASPDAAAPSESKAKGARAFGSAATGEEEDDDNDNDDDDEPNGEDGSKEGAVVGESEDQRDDRFHEQHVETGEEGEETVFSARAKLFILDGQWKERGVGALKLNVSQDDKKTARFIMRADGSHRVVLNTPIKKGIMKANEPPTDGSLRFIGITTEGKPQLYNLRMRNKETSKELFDRVVELQEAAA